MKLIEKLAVQYEKDNFISEHDGYDCSVADAYEAGFRKAREMAERIAWNYPATGVDCGMAILKMGEEEVE